MHAHSPVTDSQYIELAVSNEEKLDLIQARKAKLAKIQQIQNQEAASTSAAWYVNVWNYCVTPMTIAIQYLGTVLTYLSPAAIGFSWLHTIHTFKQLYDKDKRTNWDYGNAFFSLAASVGATVLFAVGAAVVAPALPYIAIGVFASFAGYGILNFAKNIYRALKTDKEDVRHEYFKQAGKQLINIAVNTVAIAVTVFLGIKLPEAVTKVKEAFASFDFEGAAKLGQICSDYATQGTKLLIGLTSVAVAGVASATTKLNQQSLEYLRHPTKIWYELKANPLSALKMVVMAPLRLTALVLMGPIQGLFYGVKHFFAKKPEVAAPVEVLTPQRQAASPRKVVVSAEQSGSLMKKIQAKINVIDKTFPAIEHAPAKMQAKRFQLAHLEHYVAEKAGIKNQSIEGRSYRSIDEIEKDSKVLSRNVYGTFFRSNSDASEVKQLTEEARVMFTK